MDVLDAIFTRRSIRKFTGELINDDQLRTILRAGFYAPSAHNLQPWHFIVVKEKSKLESIANFHPYGKMLPNAGCGIFVCGDAERQKLEGFLVADCAAAIENMLLAATGLGLGVVWCGLHPVKELKEFASKELGLPSNIVPIGMIAIGNRDEKREVKERFDDNKVHYDKW